MDTHSIFLRIKRKEISYLKFIFESHEGIAVVRTKDPNEAIVELMIAPGCEREVEEVIENLHSEITIEKVNLIQEGKRDV